MHLAFAPSIIRVIDSLENRDNHFNNQSVIILGEDNAVFSTIRQNMTDNNVNITNNFVPNTKSLQNHC